MRPRDLFGVAVRILALWFLTQAAYWGFWLSVKAANTGLGNPQIPAREDLAYASFYLLIGILMFLLADPIVWLVYGLPPKKLSDGDGGGD